jgi:hypothetical protein
MDESKGTSDTTQILTVNPGITESFDVVEEVNSVAFGPQANYTDRENTACRRS